MSEVAVRAGEAEYSLKRPVAPELLAVDAELQLRRLKTIGDAALVFALLRDNREHIGKFLPWALDYTEEQVVAGVVKNNIRAERGESAPYGIFEQERMIGFVALHSFNDAENYANFGYYLAQNATGRGVMTRAVRTVADMGFSHMGLSEVHVEVKPANVRSRAVAQRVGGRHATRNSEGEDVFIITPESLKESVDGDRQAPVQGEV